MAGRVDSDLAIPIELEIFERECSLGARLQLVVPRHWPDEVATVISHGRRDAFSVDGATSTRSCAWSRSSAASAMCRRPSTA